MEDYYAVLGLRKPPSDKEIRAAYQRLIANYRPQILKELEKEEKVRAERELQLIKKAYQILSDPAKRFKYDNPAFALKDTKKFNKTEAEKGRGQNCPNKCRIGNQRFHCKNSISQGPQKAFATVID